MERIKIEDGSTWPNPAGKEYGDLEWRLRYDQKSINKIDMYNAATILNMYSGLIFNPAFTLL